MHNVTRNSSKHKVGYCAKCEEKNLRVWSTQEPPNRWYCNRCWLEHDVQHRQQLRAAVRRAEALSPAEGVRAEGVEGEGLLGPRLDSSSLLSLEALGDETPQAQEAHMILSVFPEATLHRDYPMDPSTVVLRLALNSSHSSPTGGVVSIQIKILLPERYPETAPTLTLHSGVSAMRYHLFKLEQEVMRALSVQETEPLHVGAVFGVLGRVAEYVNQVRVDECADYFVLCGTCNVRLLSEGLPKWPQPSKAPSDGASCLTCRRDGVVPLRFLRPNITGNEVCSYCMCEETPLVAFPGCNCVCCITCFQHLVDVSTGSRSIVTGKGDTYGIACAIHSRNSVLADPAMFKLSAPRAYARYQYFSFELSALALGAVVCPLPNCCNFPFISDIVGSFLRCPYCLGMFCVKCKLVPLLCRCETLQPDKAVSIPSRPAKMYRGEELFSTVPSGSRLCSILVRLGERKVILHDLDLSRWNSRHLYEAISGELRLPLDDFVLFHCGMMLFPNHSASQRPLRELALHAGANVYGLLLTLAMTMRREDEIDLWEFRKQTISPGQSIQVVQIGKKCPKCKVEVIHYRGHGCHHISFGGQTCCGHHWCYLCLNEYPCNNKACSLYCDLEGKCGCPLCPDCRPGLPCSLCTGCPKCSIDEVG